MQETFTQFVRYLYLDVIDFTVERSVESQTDIIDALNWIIRRSMASLPIRPERIVFLPTGDGMGIALLDEMAPYDIHIVGAVEILRQIKAHNLERADAMRRFEVRIGLSQNVDNIITDINGTKNVAGDGINTAQRVMSVAGGSQIVVSQMVYETLSHREKYMNAFRSFTAKIKHGTIIPVYQLIDESYDGLIVSTPPQFEQKALADKRFSLYEAYYVAHVLANHQFTIKNSGHGQNNYALTVLYHFLAEDSVQIRTRSRYEDLMLHAYGEGKATIEEAFEYYKSIDFWVCNALCTYVNGLLSGLGRYFERPFIAANEKGRSKLESEYPEIYEDLKLGDA